MEDVVPIYEGTLDGPPRDGYVAWKKDDTRVITYGIGPGGDHFQHHAPTLALARTEVQAVYGNIFEENGFPGKHFFRVARAK